MYTQLLALLMTLAAFGGDTETSAQRYQRLSALAAAIDGAGDYATCSGPYATVDWCRPVWPRQSGRQLKVMLVMLGKAESNFAERVHAGRCRPDECDAIRLHDGSTFHRARTPWQLQHSSLTAPQWEEMVGAEFWPSFQAAYAASKVLGASWSKCRRDAQLAKLSGSWETWAVSGYATGGRTCAWSRAPGRVAEYQRLLAASQRPVPAMERTSGDGWRVAAQP
jgi:hypothetical protein